MRSCTAPAGALFSARFRGLAAVAGVLAACLAAPASAAEEGPADAEPGWIPGLSFDFETFGYSTKSNVVNDFNPPSQEGEGTNGTSKLLARIGGEVMGPAFEALPGSPRLFAGGGVQFDTFSSERIFKVGDVQGNTELDIARFRSTGPVPNQGTPANGIADCLEQNPQTCEVADPEDFGGQFSQIGAQLENPSWSAALGVAFDVPIGRSFLLQLRPSLAYNVEEVAMSGSIRTVTEDPPGPTPEEQEFFTIHEASAKARSTDHSLGLGLELGLTLFRSSRPVRTSIYVDTRFLWLVSDDTTTFSDSLATYQVRREPFEIRGGAGLRFSWTGFAPR